MKVTIHDVAREAGVSPTTVSRVINNNYPVKRETRARVEAAIKNLNFNPNVLARGLINQKTDTIGVLVPGITNLFFPSVVKSIDDILKKHGYSIYLCDTANKDEEIKYINLLLGRQVDGIIVIGPRTDIIKSGFYEDLSNQVPLVLINGYNKGIRCNFVLNDEDSGALEALEYLFELGHNKIALVRGNKSYSYDLKEDVYRQFLTNHKLENYINIINVGEGNSEKTVDNTMEIIQPIICSENAPTAFLACNDLMALGVLNACKRCNIDVPDKVSIIGFDNIIISRLVAPKLTTVDQNMAMLGEKAALMIVDLIEENNATRQKTILNTKLMIRESSSKAADAKK